METSAVPLLAGLLGAAGVSAGEEYDEADGEEVAGAEPEEAGEAVHPLRRMQNSSGKRIRRFNVTCAPSRRQAQTYTPFVWGRPLKRRSLQKSS